LRKALLALAAINGLAGASQVNAGVYNISYTVGGETANIVLTTSSTTDPCCGGGYDITGVTGSLGPDAITSLVPTSSPGVVTDAPVGTKPILFDNVFYPSAPNFDAYGLLFKRRQIISIFIITDLTRISS
jgi:hypothetical protein